MYAIIKSMTVGNTQSWTYPLRIYTYRNTLTHTYQQYQSQNYHTNEAMEGLAWRTVIDLQQTDYQTMTGNDVLPARGAVSAREGTGRARREGDGGVGNLYVRKGTEKGVTDKGLNKEAGNKLDG